MANVSVNLCQNIFIKSSFIKEIAKKFRKVPSQFRFRKSSTKGFKVPNSEQKFRTGNAAKMKRSVAGIGHDLAADFTEHWWKQLYDKAAKNVEVKDKNGKTKKIKIKDDQFKITNSMYHLSKSDSKAKKEEYSDFFVKTVLLTNGGSQERVRESESEEDGEKKEVMVKLTDEELFAACEGRTAHKGARHGLKASGKLARVERQEQALLALPKYTGYSHSKKHKKDKKSAPDHEEIVENANLNGEEDCIAIKKKKKKRKRCFSDEQFKDLAEKATESLPEDIELAGSNSDGSTGKKCKRKSEYNQGAVDICKPKKKKKIRDVGDGMEVGSEASEQATPTVKKNKKKKRMHCDD